MRRLASTLTWDIRVQWQLVMGLLPTYWPAKAFWMYAVDESGAPLFLAVGWIYQALLLRLLLGRVARSLASKS